LTDIAQAVRDGFARQDTGNARGSERRATKGQLSGEHRGVGATGAVRGAVGVALSLDADCGPSISRVEEQICRARAMATGEHDDARTKREHRADESLGFLILIRSERRTPGPRRADASICKTGI
jgi:hypothetical protein